jgi:hypothetical protein
MSWAPETKVRTALVHIVHQADLLAAKIEFEREWFPKFKGETKNVKNNFSLESNNFNKPNNKTAKTKVLGSIKSEGLKNLLNNI